MNAKVTICVFCALLFGIALWNLFSPDRAFSESENRYLKERPEFSAEGLTSGKYTADIDEYITDQFVARDSWVGLKTLSELALLKNASGGVYFARDGYLIEMFDEVDGAQYEKNLSYLRSFEETMAADGIAVETLLAPTASAVLENKLPPFAPEVSQRDLLLAAGEALGGLVDVLPSLRDRQDEYIYYRTDHHWTSLGAFYAYRSWREQTGRPARSLENFAQTTLSDAFYGTTYSKANLYTVRPDVITGFAPQTPVPVAVDYGGGVRADSIYEPGFLSVKDKYSVFLNANQPLTRIETESPGSKKLLLIKDSYANCFAQFLLEDYEEIHLVDLRFFRASPREYALENGITDILVLYNLKGFSSDLNLYYLTR